MTSSRDTTSDSSGRGQDGYADPMRLWADFQNWVSSLPPPDPKVFNQLNQVVDNCFDVAERMLATQREFTKLRRCHRVGRDQRCLRGAKRRQKCGIEAELTQRGLSLLSAASQSSQAAGAAVTG